jgi:hypothetical protein
MAWQSPAIDFRDTPAGIRYFSGQPQTEPVKDRPIASHLATLASHELDPDGSAYARATNQPTDIRSR